MHMRIEDYTNFEKDFYEKRTMVVMSMEEVPFEDEFLLKLLLDIFYCFLNVFNSTEFNFTAIIKHNYLVAKLRCDFENFQVLIYIITKVYVMNNMWLYL